jgi:hypothetical protein
MPHGMWQSYLLGMTMGRRPAPAANDGTPDTYPAPAMAVLCSGYAASYSQS